MKDSLTPQLLKEKLPRFLQKCVQNFETDRRYRNDLRYLCVWLQLMDFVDDPRALLRTMELNQIGKKRALFYQAYALYYEKVKKFEEAEKMYHLGVQNLAEPLGELQKSYEQFLQRMMRHKNKRIQEGKNAKRPPLSARSIGGNNENVCRVGDHPMKTHPNESLPKTGELPKNKKVLEESSWIVPMKELDEHSKFCSDDTIVVKFVDTAIVGKSEAEDACHHGLVDPTINTKEAMNAINSMFREPLEPALIGRRSWKTQPQVEVSPNNEFEVFVDDISDHGVESSHPKEGKESFEIFIDDEGSSDMGRDRNDEKEVNSKEGFVFLRPKDEDVETLARPKFREDTVVGRFVGSMISDESVVENVCHHGLVEPTVNLKEAMDDINNMFGKPIEFKRPSRAKKMEKAPARKKEDDFSGGFSILPDDDLKPPQQGGHKSKLIKKSSESDLFEPTVHTKEAMDEINKMFGMPLDF